MSICWDGAEPLDSCQIFHLKDTPIPVWHMIFFRLFVFVHFYVSLHIEHKLPYIRSQNSHKTIQMNGNNSKNCPKYHFTILCHIDFLFNFFFFSLFSVCCQFSSSDFLAENFAQILWFLKFNLREKKTDEKWQIYKLGCNRNEAIKLKWITNKITR